MAGLIEKTPDMGRNALGNYLAQATTRATEAKSGQGMLARGRKPAENIQAVTEELDAVRRAQAKLQQAIYETSQVQRRLRAPPQLTSDELESDSEILPVRHHSVY